MDELRDFMFDHVYLGARQKRRAIQDRPPPPHALRPLRLRPHQLPDGGGAPGTDPGQRVVDYLAGMTDRYAVRVFEDLTIPDSFAL